MKPEKPRTLKQNNSLHKYFELLAIELNDAGYDMKAVLKPEVDIPWEKETIKKYLWKPIQKAFKLKESTTELTTAEINQVYEVLNRHLGDKFGIHVPFPSEEQEMFNSLEN